MRQLFVQNTNSLIAPVLRLISNKCSLVELLSKQQKLAKGTLYFPLQITCMRRQQPFVTAEQFVCTVRKKESNQITEQIIPLKLYSIVSATASSIPVSVFFFLFQFIVRPQMYVQMQLTGDADDASRKKKFEDILIRFLWSAVKSANTCSNRWVAKIRYLTVSCHCENWEKNTSSPESVSLVVNWKVSTVDSSWWSNRYEWKMSRWVLPNNV